MELKSNIDIPDVLLPVAIADQWTNLDQEVRYRVVNRVKLHAASRSCEQYNEMILKARFKPSI
jgi:hypothetical protein